MQNRLLILRCKRNEIAVNLTSGEPCACGKTRCSECLFNGRKHYEGMLTEWAEKEYEEPPVDWSKVAVDTPILVRDYEEDVGKKTFCKNTRTEWCTHGMKGQHLGAHVRVTI